MSFTLSIKEGKSLSFICFRGCSVIAIELDKQRLEMAKVNAEVYGVKDKIKWIHGDCLEVLPTLRVRPPLSWADD